ncbi:hypothetical protein F5Y04DRAFT_229293 [Hypomontagnella monticulosa]|nr:hypothetical protein F5Y04DRAFT_229293 [Hypomontagnella monticulosa]
MPQSSSAKVGKKRGPRSRSGCWTCRIRRVKCDEARPICKRCSSTGRTCDGYELQPIEVREAARGTERQLRAKETGVSSEPNLVLTYQPRVAPYMSTTEAQSFDFFWRQTSQETPGFYKTELWGRLIPQLCNSEPAIRHATIAVGAMHAKFMGTSPSLRVQTFGILEGRHAFAIQQYVKALALLKDRLSNSSSSGNAEIALTCCLLFICLEMLQGNRVGAVEHLRTGLRVVAGIPSQVRLDYNTGERSLVMRPKADRLLDQLTTLFGRLNLEIVAFCERAPAIRLALETDMLVPTPPPSVLIVFSNLEEARASLDVLRNRALWVTGELLNRSKSKIKANTNCWAVQRCLEYAASRTVDLSEDLALAKELRDVQRDITLWLGAFRSYIASQEATPPAMFLEIRHFCVLFQAMTCQQTTEIVCDRFNDYFKRIVSLAAKIGSTQPLTFTIEAGVIPSLYLIALKCRMPEVRRQAISLLHHGTFQEGMWEGKLIAKFVEQAADWEEALAGASSAGPIASSAHIPEHARFCDVVLAATPEPGRGKIVCARYLHESSQEVAVFEKTFDI